MTYYSGLSDQQEHYVFMNGQEGFGRDACHRIQMQDMARRRANQQRKESTDAGTLSTETTGGSPPPVQEPGG